MKTGYFLLEDGNKIEFELYPEAAPGTVANFEKLAFASRGVLLAVIVLTFFWTVFRGQDRKIELSFLFFLVIGGELYEEGIRRLFHSLHPVHAPLESHVLYPFPSEQTLTAFVIFGFCAYLFVRHSHKTRLQTVAFFCLLSFYSSSG